MEQFNYPVIKKIILTVVMLSLVIVSAWPESSNRAADSNAILGGLYDKIIVIDPGHGGADPGAVLDELSEADLNMVLSLALKEEMEKHGAKVILTRQGNSGLVPIKNMSYYERWYILQKRKNYALRQKCDILISIHANSDKDIKSSGAIVFYSDNNSGKIAAAIQEKLNQLGLRPRKPVKSRFTVISNLDIPAVLIETGFITNRKDRALMVNKPGLIAQKICSGIIDYVEMNITQSTEAQND